MYNVRYGTGCQGKPFQDVATQRRCKRLAYTHNNLKKYVIYGCTELTDEMYNSGQEKDGIMYPTFEGWTKIMDVECYKPSGQDNPNITNEDIEYIQNGDEHEVPIELLISVM